MKERTYHSLKWFTDRIGQTVYREDVSCKCTTCKNVTETGLVIKNQQHAEYLEMIQIDLNLNYQDKEFKIKII